LTNSTAARTSGSGVSRASPADQFVVEWVDERPAGVLGQPLGQGLGVLVRRSAEDDLSAGRLDRRPPDRVHPVRHAHRDPHAGPLCDNGDGSPVIVARGRDDALRLCVRVGRDAVVRTSDLERPGQLGVLQLNQAFPLSRNSYGSLARLDLAGERYRVHRLDVVPGVERLPLTRKILLENLLRHEDGATVTADQIAALLRGTRDVVSFSPSWVFLHDTNGVPVLTDLAALRDAVAAAGGDPRR
jgi:hypothetical protein